jgi:hypothetical protein
MLLTSQVTSFEMRVGVPPGHVQRGNSSGVVNQLLPCSRRNGHAVLLLLLLLLLPVVLPSFLTKQHRSSRRVSQA